MLCLEDCGGIKALVGLGRASTTMKGVGTPAPNEYFNSPLPVRLAHLAGEHGENPGPTCGLFARYFLWGCVCVCCICVTLCVVSICFVCVCVCMLVHLCMHACLLFSDSLNVDNCF